MGRAEELFAHIKAGGAAEVHAMIKARVVEELFLDYKQSSTPLPGAKLSEDDRKNLAKAVAGFGNSEGGVVVWGVDCRQTQDGDVPKAPAPISHPLALKTLFDGAVGGLTLPAHSNVENIHLLNSAGKDGFVITYVPGGLHVPYQTLFPKREYYIRAGSGFVSVPHGVLAGMFGRAPQPNVVPVITFEGGQTSEGVSPAIRLIMQVYLINQGRGLARDMFCIVEDMLPRGSNLSFNVHAVERRLSTTRDGRTIFTAILGAETILPPGAEIRAFAIVLNVDKNGKGDHSLTVSSGSGNGPGAAVAVTFPGRVIDEAFAHYTHRYADAASRQAAEREYAKQLKACLPRS